MDMNRTFYPKKEAQRPKWRLIDAKGQIVGRLSTQIADILRGKNNPHYTPHTDTGDYVVVINADKVIFTKDKMETKEYVRYTGWIGGQKTLTAQEVMDRDPARILMHSVKGMLPKNKLSRDLLRKLKVYAGEEHPHTAQITTSKK